MHHYFAVAPWSVKSSWNFSSVLSLAKCPAIGDLCNDSSISLLSPMGTTYWNLLSSSFFLTPYIRTRELFLTSRNLRNSFLFLVMRFLLVFLVWILGKSWKMPPDSRRLTQHVLTVPFVFYWELFLVSLLLRLLCHVWKTSRVRLRPNLYSAFEFNLKIASSRNDKPFF